MANTDVGIGTGVTVKKNAVSLGNVTNLTLSGASRPALSTAHLGSLITNPQVPGALTNWGSMAMDLNIAPDTDIDLLLTEAVATATDFIIQFDGTATTNVVTVAAFCTDHDLFAIPLEDVMTASMTWQLTEIPVWS